MHAFLAGLGVGVLGGGALSYLFAQRVINKYKTIIANMQTVARAFEGDRPPHK